MLKNLKFLWFLPWLTVALLLLGASYGVGYYLAMNNPEYIKEREAKLEAKLHNAEQYIQTLQHDIAKQKVGGDIDKKAVSEARKGIIDLDNQVADLKAEVAFYKNYMDPRKSKPQALIQSWEMKRLGEEYGKNAYGYKLVLQKTESDNHEDKVFTVHISAAWEGAKNAALETSATVAESGTSTVAEIETQVQHSVELVKSQLNFKYFKVLRGIVNVPSGVKPSLVIVNLESKGKKLVTQEYPWELQ